jgi:hypothetical protein
MITEHYVGALALHVGGEPPTVDDYDPGAALWVNRFHFPEERRMVPGPEDAFNALYSTYKLSLALRDYFVLACCGEARHAKAHAKCYLRGPYAPLPGDERTKAGTTPAKHFTWVSLAQITQHLFEEGNWDSSYGGPSWAMIAAHALKHPGPLSPDVEYRKRLVVWVEKAINLAHNNGLALDKGFIFDDVCITCLQCLLDAFASGPNSIHYMLRALTNANYNRHCYTRRIRGLNPWAVRWAALLFGVQLPVAPWDYTEVKWGYKNAWNHWFFEPSYREEDYDDEENNTYETQKEEQYDGFAILAT